MERMRGLLERLEAAGIPLGESIFNTMLEVDISRFTDEDVTPFFHDRPLMFIEVESHAVKTISAPHMIATMLHHLELSENQNVLLIGAKGGYLATLLAKIVGMEGSVIVLDPCEEVVSHVSQRCVEESIQIHLLDDFVNGPDNELGKVDRILISGQLDIVPEWIHHIIEDGGFLLAPIGSREGQMLTKRERQGKELIDTELGPVIFGSVDARMNVIEAPCPAEMADILEECIHAMESMGFLDANEVASSFDMVAKLRALPEDMPPPEPGESDHPMAKILMEESAWFLRLLPMIQLMMDPGLASPGSPDDQDWSHEDLIP